MPLSTEDMALQMFQREGADRIRIMLANQLVAPAFVPFMTKWLAEEEIKERRYNETIETRRFDLQMVEAKSASRAAWIAAWASIIGLLIGVIGIGATIYFKG